MEISGILVKMSNMCYILLITICIAAEIIITHLYVQFAINEEN